MVAVTQWNIMEYRHMPSTQITGGQITGGHGEIGENKITF